MTNQQGKNIDENGAICVKNCAKSFVSETSGDFTLPDYQSEIRRVLRVCATPLPPSKYVGADSIEFSGSVDYQLIYVGADGGIYSAPLTGEYAFSVPTDKGCPAAPQTVLCDIACDSASVKVSGPRRLNVKSRLRANVRSFGDIPSSSALTSDMDPTGIYARTERVEALKLHTASADDLTLTYSTPLGGEDVRVVSADCRVSVTNCEMRRGEIFCRGNAAIKLLCRREDSGEYQVRTGNVPFDCRMECDADESFSCRAGAMVSDMSVNVTDSSIECGVGVIVEAAAMKNEAVDYTADVYSTKNDCECSTVKVMPSRCISCFSSSLTFSERIPLSDTSIPADSTIVDADMSVIYDKCDLINGKYTFTGNAKIYVLYESAGEIYGATVSIPTKYEAQTAAMGEAISFRMEGVATDVRVRAEDSELKADAELYLSGDCIGESAIEMVDNVSLGAELHKKDRDVTVCYIAEDDTLWSIAKRYLVSPESIMGDPEKDRFVIIE